MTHLRHQPGGRPVLVGSVLLGSALLVRCTGPHDFVPPERSEIPPGPPAKHTIAGAFAKLDLPQPAFGTRPTAELAGDTPTLAQTFAIIKPRAPLANALAPGMDSFTQRRISRLIARQVDVVPGETSSLSIHGPSTDAPLTDGSNALAGRPAGHGFAILLPDFTADEEPAQREQASDAVDPRTASAPRIAFAPVIEMGSATEDDAAESRREAPLRADARPPAPATTANSLTGDRMSEAGSPSTNVPSIALAFPRPRPTATGTAALPATDAPEEILPEETQTLAPGNPAQGVAAAMDAPEITYDDELILEIRAAGAPVSDTVIAYGTRQGVYLPFGDITRYLDLAFVVSDDGNFASGWFLAEDRTLTIDLRQQEMVLNGAARPLGTGDAVAFDGELYLRSDVFAQILPLSITPNLRNQSIAIATTETFPFEERLAREARRRRLEAAGGQEQERRWPREETPYRLLTVPTGDLDLRAVSDDARGARGEIDVRLAGDLALLTAQAFAGADTARGLTGAFLSLGRRDPDGDLLGPLGATAFSVGDVASPSLPIGLRSVSGRGAYITNSPIQSASIFDRVDLRGFLQDGYEVELYRNDILVDSTRTPINGQYEFEQVALDYGLNVFRLVFYGPQGQRREEVRRISVGDGRLSPGQFVYEAGATQKDFNLLGVKPPDFVPLQDYGQWRAGARLAYGLSRDITTEFAGAWFESGEDQRWLASAGIRSGFGRIATKADIALADQSAWGINLGLGARFAAGSAAFSHAEYGGPFVDETRGFGSEPLVRATELDMNYSFELGSATAPFFVPVALRARRLEYLAGRTRTDASLRASTRFAGLLASNTLTYASSSGEGFATREQILGNFDLGTLSRDRLQVRGSLGYRIAPSPDLLQLGAEANYRLDDRTLVSGSAAYGLRSDDLRFGFSAIREFDDFALALTARYGLSDGSHYVGLRASLSFGREPIGGRWFVDPPGLAFSGSASVRAYQDMDGDGRFDPGADTVLPDVTFAVPGGTAITDERGIARLTQLGDSARTTIQVDPASLPDITLLPRTRGIEIVPRPGRTHATDFAILASSEVEGTVSFRSAGGDRGVSGVRLRLSGVGEEAEQVRRTEADGYFFFEQVLPGAYTITLDPDQAARLQLCLAGETGFEVSAQSDIIVRNLTVTTCQVPG